MQICQGFTGHERHWPVHNAFCYPVLYIRFNTRVASQASQILRKCLKAFSFRAEDYLLKDSANLDLRVREILAAHTDYQPDEITLLTMPRLFGYAFNPVSFWLCHRAEKLERVLCEVNNTFGERHFYWVQPQDGQEWTMAKKCFHVSPFLPVEGTYQFRFKDNSKQTRVDIDYYSETGEKVLSTWIDVRHQALSEVSFLSLFAKYGWHTVLVVLRIHFQALRLSLKRVPFFKKPSPPTQKVSA